MICQLADGKEVQQQIIELAKERWCTACPTSHFNTGNIITVQTEKPPGKKKQWPGWTVQAIVSIYKANQDGNIGNILSIRWFKEAKVFQPNKDQGYAHVHVHAMQERLDLPINIKKDIEIMTSEASFPKNRSHFWCKIDKKSKTIYILQTDIWPFDPIFIQDVNLNNRKDKNTFVLEKSELDIKEKPAFHTPSGVIIVTGHEGVSPQQAASMLSAKLIHNCR
jgi:hypothetical protein